jgi:hypothetical protein
LRGQRVCAFGQFPRCSGFSQAVLQAREHEQQVDALGGTEIGIFVELPRTQAP